MRTLATTVALCTSSPAHRSINVSIPTPSTVVETVPRGLTSWSLTFALAAAMLSARDPRVPLTDGLAGTSASRRHGTAPAFSSPPGGPSQGHDHSQRGSTPPTTSTGDPSGSSSPNLGPTGGSLPTGPDGATRPEETGTKDAHTF